MQEWVIAAADEGQRLDKYLKRKLSEAPTSFFYKMMRKKNITLNGRKCTGAEQLRTGDRVLLFLSEETIGKFQAASEGENQASLLAQECRKACMEMTPVMIRKLGHDPVLFSDHNILIMEKPYGFLSQKAHPEDLSMNEWMIGFLLQHGEITEKSLESFHPSVCNRLDRNTGGILIGAKTLKGAQQMSGGLKDRSLRKYYHMIVGGRLEGDGVLEGWLLKDPKTNQVRFCDRETSGAVYSRTLYHTLKNGYDPDGRPITLVEAELITGKTHQLRAHFAGTGHPIAGDPKYGDGNWNRKLLERFGIHNQMLYCVRVVLPAGCSEADPQRECTISCPEPVLFHKIFKY